MSHGAIYAAMELQREFSAYLRKLRTQLPKVPGEFSELCGVASTECGHFASKKYAPDSGTLLSSKMARAHLERLNKAAPTRWKIASGHRCDNVEAFIKFLDAYAAQIKNLFANNGHATRYDPVAITLYEAVYDFCESMRSENPPPFFRVGYEDRLKREVASILSGGKEPESPAIAARRRTPAEAISPIPATPPMWEKAGDDKRSMEEQDDDEPIGALSPPRPSTPFVVKRDSGISSWLPGDNEKIGGPGMADAPRAAQPIGGNIPAAKLGQPKTDELPLFGERTIHDANMEQRVAEDVVPDLIRRGKTLEAPAMWSALVGRSLGKYKLESLIGEGASAFVYRSTHPTLRVPVAVKVLRESGGEAAHQRVEAFFEEARLSVQIYHPHAVRVFDLDEHDGRHFIVMEFVEGATIKDLIDEEGHIEELRSLEIAASVADVLGTAHQKKIIHRDIKPQNIIVTRTGDIKVSDLGLAKKGQIDDSAGGRKIVGTPLYIAPEAIKNPGRVDFRVDVYSLGATLYHMATGRPPFTGASMDELFQAHLSHFLPDPRSKRKELSAATSNLIVKMMEKDPAKRHRSYEELNEKIEEAIDQISGHGRRKKGIGGVLKGLFGGR